MSRGERKAMVRRDIPGLSLSRQCEVLSISRSSFYYVMKGESPSSLALMRRIDELFLKYPFYGSRQMVRQLRREGICQSASNFDPLSASNIDPPFGTVEVVPVVHRGDPRGFV